MSGKTALMPLPNDMPLERTNQIFLRPIHQDGVGTLFG
jgi:hypothetical protein